MVDYPTFSALRLAHIFPREFLEAYRFYSPISPKSGFDLEYLGGQWEEELIDGVQFFYPQKNGAMLGVVELWGAGCVVASAVRDKPESLSANLIPAWTTNVNRVLEALDMPVRMGSVEAAVRALAAGQVQSHDFPDEWYALYPDVAKGSLRSLSFACRAPQIYHAHAVVHAATGLLSLWVRRPDLIRANDHEDAYDRCTEGIFDEGLE